MLKNTLAIYFALVLWTITQEAFAALTGWAAEKYKAAVEKRARSLLKQHGVPVPPAQPEQPPQPAQ